MAHYTGPKGKVNRRLGLMVYENNGARKALERRDTPPGMHTRRGKLSTYGQALLEKQKVKHYYGLGERSLVRLFSKARRTQGNTGSALLILCERRLDNVICRAGIAKTRPQARQGVVHGHFLVNGHRVDKPSFLVQAGDVISVKNREGIAELYRAQVAASAQDPPHWLHRAADQLRVDVRALPTVEDVSLPIEVGWVVELLSRG